MNARGGAHDRGAALVDVIFAAGLVAVLSGIAIPVIEAARAHGAARAGARVVAARLQQARMDALKRNAMVAVRFDPANLDLFRVYADGDGDGVSQTDIDAATDPPLTPAQHLSDFARAVVLRVRDEVPEPDGGGTIAAGTDPLRIGPTSILSFSPLGSATGGTIYLAGVDGPQMAIRIFGATGRIRVLEFDRASAQWRER